MTVNPQFVNASANNFQLAANSPLCNSGKYNHDYGAKLNSNPPALPQYLSVSPIGNNNVTLEIAPSKLSYKGNLLDTLSHIQIYRNGDPLTTIAVTSLDDTISYIDNLPKSDFFEYQVCVFDTAQNASLFLSSALTWYGQPIAGIVIWELDPTPVSGAALKTELLQNNLSEQEIHLAGNAGKYPLNGNIQAVFVCLGMHNNNHVLAYDEGMVLKNYVDAGGNLYMEGGSTWYLDTMSPVHSYFGVYPVSYGVNSTLSQISGVSGTPFENISLLYQGDGLFPDKIESAYSSAVEIFVDPNQPASEDGIAIANNGGFYRTIAASFEFGGITDGQYPSTKTAVMEKYLQFFGILPSTVQSGANLTKIPKEFTLLQNYPNPFNGSTNIRFGIENTGRVELQIFNILGQKVFQHDFGNMDAGWHQLHWNGKNDKGIHISSGIYYYRVQFFSENSINQQQTGKMFFAQ